MKIFIYGQGKSGTTILFYKIKTAIEKKFPNATFTSVFEPEGLEKANGKTHIIRKNEEPILVEDNMLTKALLPNYKNIGFSLENARSIDADKKILIVRDPRDRWISGFFYRWYKLAASNPEEFKTKVALTQLKEQNPKLIPFFSLNSFNKKENDELIKKQRYLTKQLSDFVSTATENGWFIFYYDDLVAGKFNKLSEFLEMEVGEGEVEDRFKRLARSKSANNWRIWYNEDDIVFFKEIYQDFLEPLGYNPEDWRLDNVDSINPEQGSNYMLSLAKLNPAKPDSLISKLKKSLKID